MAGPVTGLTPAPLSTVTSSEPLSTGVHVQPQWDVIELLPPAAADRQRALRQRAADAHAVIPEFEQVRTASMARVSAANALKRLTDHPQDHGFNLPPTDRRVIEATKLLEKATADFERLKQLQEVRAAEFQSAGAASAACEAWVRDGRPPGTALEDYEAEPVKLNKGEGILDGIERLRRRGRELKADLHRISSSPFPSSYCKQRMREQIEALAARGAPDIANLIEHDRSVIWPTQNVRSQVYNTEVPSFASAELPDTLALFAWMHRDALIAALDREIDAESDDKSALSHEARQKAEAVVMGDLLAVERDEAALVWSAQSQSLPVEHRSDCDPRAILQIRLITAPGATSGPSSWMHAFDIVKPGR